MKTVIIEDEENAQRLLIKHLKRYCKQVEVVATASTPLEGVKMINQHEPELIFLDVELQQGKGFEVLEALPNRTFQTIFTTAHNKYAVEAFRFQAADYLLKPIDPEELVEAVDRCAARSQKEHPREYEELIQEYRNGSISKIAVPTRYGLAYLWLKDIHYIKSDGNYCCIHLLSDKKPILVTRNLKSFDDLLKSKGFVRIHQSHIINAIHVEEYNRSDGGFVFLSGNIQLEVSKRNRALLLASLGSISETL